MLPNPALIAIAGLVLAAAVHAAPDTTPRIEWDQTTLRLVQRGATYGRMIWLSDGSILCIHDRGGNVWVRKSDDEGVSWRKPVLVATYPHGVATNPEILQLRNGWVLASYNERPRDEVRPFAIRARISRDEGASWGGSCLVHEAGVRSENGCWEPAQIQLPSGEVQLFFANESPYRHSNEQEISMCRSRDNGLTWGSAERISFRAGRRDGMPVPLVLADGRGVVVAIEDNGLRGRMKPVVIFSSLAGNWREPFVSGDSPRRLSALKRPLPAKVYAGAPYIRQLPTGETVLSVQSTEGGRPRPRMVVYVGDATARNFAGKSAPFDVPGDVGCMWNSLFVRDESTITAISATRINGQRGLWAIDGRLVREAER